MRRRKFLFTSGTALLGSTAITGSRRPVIGLDFDLSTEITADPSTADTILVNFTSFELLPQYVDESAGKATITITLEVENQDTVQYSTEQQLTNGQKVTKSDIGSIIPLVVDDIDTTSSIDGEVRINVDHPSVSNSYEQSFSITDGSNYIPDSGVSLWEFEQDTTDSWGNYNLELGGSPTYTTTSSVGGYALDFDGSDDYAEVSASPIISGSANRTFTAWINRESSQNVQSTIFGMGGDGSSGHRWDFRLDNGNLRIEIEGSKYTTSLTPTAGTYEFVACVLDGTTIGNHTVYLNDTSESTSGTLPVDTQTGETYLGFSAFGGGESDRHYSGSIDDARVYNKALTDTELSNLRQTGSIDG